MDTQKSSKKSKSALVALIIAIISLVLSPIPIVNNFAFFLAVLAVIFGIIAFVRTKKNKKRGRNMAIIALVLAVLAGAVVLISQQFYGNSLDKAGKNLQTSADDASGKNTDQLLRKDVTVSLGAFQATPGDYTTNTVLPVKVTNKNSQPKSYTIQIEAVDASGTRITDDTVVATNLGGNQSQDFQAFQYVSSDQIDALKTATFKVASVSEY